MFPKVFEPWKFDCIQNILTILLYVMFVTESTDTDKAKTEEEEAQDDGKVPSFTVLLHGSLKVEGMVALTKVA